MFQKDRKLIISSKLPLVESETAYIWKKINYFVFSFFFVCRWWLKNERFIERYLLERIKTSVGDLQFTVRQKHDLVGHLILPRVFPIGRNVRCVFRLVGQILILAGHGPMSDRYFKACYIYYIYYSRKKTTNILKYFVYCLYQFMSAFTHKHWLWVSWPISITNCNNREYQMCIKNPAEHLPWNLFAKIVNS